MSTPPLVSVLVATCNRAELLREALGSVLGQTFHRLEVVVCDDGSTDDTEAVVRSFGNPVRHLRLPHTGLPGFVRNRGAEAAHGELLAFLDDDDLWEPDKLSRQVALLERDPGLGVVCAGRRVLHPDGSLSPPLLPPARHGEVHLLELALSARFPHVCTVLVRTSLFREVGGFDESLTTAEDLDLLLRLGRSARTASVPEALVKVRRTPGSLSERSGTMAFRNAIGVLERQLLAGGLTPLQRLRCRHTLSRLGGGLAEHLAREGDGKGARAAALGSVRSAPFLPSSWLGAARAWLRA